MKIRCTNPTVHVYTLIYTQAHIHKKTYTEMVMLDLPIMKTTEKWLTEEWIKWIIYTIKYFAKVKIEWIMF